MKTKGSTGDWAFDEEINGLRNGILLFGNDGYGSFQVRMTGKPANLGLSKAVPDPCQSCFKRKTTSVGLLEEKLTNTTTGIWVHHK